MRAASLRALPARDCLERGDTEKSDLSWTAICAKLSALASISRTVGLSERNGLRGPSDVSPAGRVCDVLRYSL